MTTIDNPLSQLALLYQHLEDRLRWSTSMKRPMTLKELNEYDKIKVVIRSPYQTRDCLKTLINRGFVTKHGTGQKATFEWNLSAGPFIMNSRQFQHRVKQPSVPRITKVITRYQTVEREVEVPKAAPRKLSNEQRLVLSNLGFAVRFSMDNDQIKVREL